MTDKYQINNDEYSAPNSPAEREMVSIKIPSSNTPDREDKYEELTLEIPKFMFCLSLSQGFKIIGILEVVAFVL